MLLDALTSLVRRYGPFRSALAVTVIGVAVSAIITALTLVAPGRDLFPGLYLATLTPLALALPVIYLTHLAFEPADRLQQALRISESEAHKAQAMLRDAIEGFPGGFVLFDADDRLVLCNQQHRDMYAGIADLIVPGISFAELAHAVAERNVVRGTGLPEKYAEERLLHRQQRSPPLEQQMTDGRWILVNEQGTENGQTVVVRTDITQFKRASDALRESEERFFRVFQSSPTMICIIDAKSHRFSDVNESWLKVFGFERDEVIGRTSIETGLWTDPHQHQILLDILRDEGRVSGFVQQSRIPNGQLIDCIISGETLELDGRPHYLFVTEDVFERKRVDRLKNEFIATVSHEIRTPLTSISGSLSLLTGGAGGEIPESSQRLLTIAETNSDRLVRLGNDILDLEKIESGEMMFRNQTVELNTVAERALKINQAYGDQYGVRFKLTHQECGAMVNADRDRLDQVFSNLLSNAAKFSPRDGDVEVEVTVSRHNGMIRTTVTDHGPGIPEEFRDCIFEKFTQADTSDARHIKGTGLGLNIVKQIVEQTDGIVGREPNSSKGTTFYFDLPDSHARNHPADEYTPKDA